MVYLLVLSIPCSEALNGDDVGSSISWVVIIIFDDCINQHWALHVADADYSREKPGLSRLLLVSGDSGGRAPTTAFDRSNLRWLGIGS